MSDTLLAALARRAADVQLQIDAEPRQLLSLSNDELACVLHHLPLAHDIALVARLFSPTKQLRNASSSVAPPCRGVKDEL